MLLTDARFDIPAKMPFLPGASPFRQKGHVYRGNLEFIKTVVPGGLDALRDRLPTPAIGKFLGQRFNVSDWYDSLPNMHLQAVVAQVRGISFDEQARQNGAYHSRERFKGFLSLVLRVISTENVALWAPRGPSMYYSFGKFRAHVVGEQHVALQVSGIPTTLVRWIGAVFTGAVTEMLTVSGGREVQVKFSPVKPEGMQSGVQLWQLDAKVTWMS